MEEFSTQLQTCRSVDQLLNLGQSFWKCYDSNAIICVPCYVANPRHGKITYIFGMAEEDFTNEDATPQYFRDLKIKIKEHVRSQHHLKIADPGLLLNNRELSDRNLLAGMIIGREAYYMVKKGHSYNSFEERLGLIAGHGLDIGDINHSKEMARSLTECFFRALKEQVINDLHQNIPATQKPSFFSISADKATLGSHTLHIILAIFFQNGKFRAYVLGSSINQNGTGVGLGEEIYDALRDYMEPEFIKSQ